MKKIKTRLEEITREICIGFNAKYEFNYLKQYPPTINDAAFNTFLKEIAVIVKIWKTLLFTFMTGGVAYYLEKVKGNMCFIGTRDEEYNYPLHNQNFNFNEEVLYTGTAFLAASTVNYLMI
jgi:metal-dependent amidase/aminoacylase/carboxypeptidase family protein